MRTWLDGVEVGEDASATVADAYAVGAPTPLGAGVFETLRVVGGQPFALTRHLRRMVSSALAVGLPDVDVAFVRQVVEEACTELLEPSRLRLTWSWGPSGAGEGALLTLTTSALPRAAPTVSVVTVPWRRNPRGVLAGHKATSYGESMLAAAYARRQGADEGVLLTPGGLVSEGSATNVFHVVGGEVRTSSLATGCLPGVTRALVLEWWDGCEVDAREDEVLAADEVFVTSSTRGPVPVRQWGGRVWTAPGPVTSGLVQEWWSRVAADPDP